MMKFSYQWLQDYFSSPLPSSDKLAELLTMRAFQVAAIERRGEDDALSIDILPNRAPDAMGHDGMAREISALLEMPLKKQKTQKPREAKHARASDALFVAVDAPEYCPRYSARIMRGVRIGASPQWLRERLAVSGLRTINTAVDAANYIMLKTGQPIHVFDYDTLAGSSGKKKIIRVRLAEKREPFVSLEGKRYTLDSSMLVIADAHDVIGLAGVKGAKKAEVSERSTNLVLEAANFSGPLLRRTTRSLKLTSDASTRFVNALDPNTTVPALDELALLIQKLCGGTIAKGIVDVYKRRVIPKTISLFPSRVNEVLGINIPVSAMVKILKRLSLKPKKAAAKKSIQPYWNVQIPTCRGDLSIEEDLIEEIGRLYGYEHIKAAPYHGMMRAVDKDEQYVWSMRIRERLAGFGFAEILSYAFIGDVREVALLDEHRGVKLELENPARPDMQFLRPILSFGMMHAIAKNDARRDDIRMFEIGAVYQQGNFGNNAHGVFEESHINIAVSRKEHASGELFYELKGVFGALTESLGLGDLVWFDDVPNGPAELGAMTRMLMHPYRSAELKIGDSRIGHIGMLNPEVQRSWKIKKPVAFCELSLARLIEAGNKELEYQEISRYPALVRDLALFVPANEKIIRILDVIEHTAGPLLIDTDLFDTYEGSEAPDGKKNIAFHLVFQSNERTLNDREVNEIMERTIKALEERPEWEVRK